MGCGSIEVSVDVMPAGKSGLWRIWVIGPGDGTTPRDQHRALKVSKVGPMSGCVMHALGITRVLIHGRWEIGKLRNSFSTATQSLSA